MSKNTKLKKLNKQQKQAAELLAKAATEFIQLKNRIINPDGAFDSARRFFLAEEFECCRFIRTPSRAFPFSKMKHARTADHAAHKFNVESSKIKKVKNLFDKFEDIKPESTFYKILQGTLSKEELVHKLISLQHEAVKKFAIEVILWEK